MAEAMGNPVEDLSQRTSTVSVWALPDGMWTSTVHSAPLWVRTGQGNGSRAADWARTDQTLERQADGTVIPVAQVNGIVLAGGGPATVLLSETDPATGASIQLLWDGSRLPRPNLDGGRATYKNVYPGVDLVIDILPVGFEQYFVIRTRAALKTAPDLHLDLAVAGASIVDDGHGGFDIVAPDGTSLGHSPAALAWDANTDAARTTSVLGAWSALPHEPGTQLAGLPIAPGAAFTAANVAADSGLEVVSTTRTVQGNHVRVGLIVPVDWVASPSTVFPIVVDPSIGTPYWDTYVKYDDGLDHSLSADLLIGTANSGTNIFRSFLTWPTDDFVGRDITWAGMYLWEYHSWSCNETSWSVYVTADPVVQVRTWGSQPEASSWAATTLSTTVGYSSSCADAWVGVDITAHAKYWSRQAGGYQSVALYADSEGDNYYWKRFYSSNTSLSPYLSYTYNSYPNVPTALTVDGQALTANRTSSVVRPVVSAVVSDPDGGQVRALFTVKQGSVVIVDSLPGTVVNSGQASTATLPYGLASNVTYTIVVKATDTRLIGGAASPTYTFVGPTGSVREIPAGDDGKTGAAS